MYLLMVRVQLFKNVHSIIDETVLKVSDAKLVSCVTHTDPVGLRVTLEECVYVGNSLVVNCIIYINFNTNVVQGVFNFAVTN